ncbi:MAG: trimethylamine methyltransferase family protein, partial [Thiolinea sp.]
CTGYEKIIMDADRCAALQRFAAGVDVSDEALALSAVQEVGPSGHYLGCEHTQANFEQAFYHAEMADNATFEQWSEEGGSWQHERANQRWKQMLKDYEAPPMDTSVREELEAFVARREREILPG